MIFGKLLNTFVYSAYLFLLLNHSGKIAVFHVVHRGFSGTYVKEYIEASNPAFAIGEYWDSLAYEHGNLCYNQGK